MSTGSKTVADRLAVFIAEGFGSGRFPVAPGTVGTAVGFIWVYLLLLPRSMPIYVGGIVLGFFLAVYIGQRAEKVMGLKDPGSIVIDEITALPLVFLPAVLVHAQGSTLPSPYIYISSLKLFALPVVAFFLFRIFDVLKPFGIARIQDLPGGYGLVLDDFLAAIPSALLLWLYIKIAG